MTKDHDETTQYPISGRPTQDPLVQVRAYWEGLRDNGAIPQRDQISPRGIESALSSTFLIERVAPGIARFRIAGMELADIMGMEARGMPISAFFTTEGRPVLATKLEQMFSDPAILTMDLAADAGLGRPALTARLLALPLRDDAGHIRLALGCIALTGTIGRSPRRFDIRHATLSALDAPRRQPAAPRERGFAPQVIASTDQHAFAEPAARFEGAPRARPHLRVVE